MLNIPATDALAVEVVSAIRNGDIDSLQRLLDGNADLATARIIDDCGFGRSLLHVATDWPGHFPHGARTVAALIAAGADVNATVPHLDRPEVAETPLHWGASSNDVEVLDALLDGGADIEAPGAVFTGGTAMSDACVFAQWNAARRLLERGASTTLWQAASLGLLDRMKEYFESDSGELPSKDEITGSFWGACHGGQRNTAEYLLGRGAELNWIGWEGMTPLDAALRNGNAEVIEWIGNQGAKSAKELK